MSHYTFFIQDNDTILCSPSYTCPAKSDSTAQRLHHSKVGHSPHWLFLCNIRWLERQHIYDPCVIYKSIQS